MEHSGQSSAVFLDESIKEDLQTTVIQVRNYNYYYSYTNICIYTNNAIQIIDNMHNLIFN